MNNTEPDKPTSSEDQQSRSVVSPTPGPVTTAPDTKEKNKARPQAPPIESVSQLLRAVYNGKFKRSTLKKAELAAMQSARPPSGPESVELVGLALPDRTLARTRQLMLIGAGLGGSVIAGQITKLARDVLRSHPAFKSESLAGVLENLPDAPTGDKAVLALTSQDYASLPWPEGNKSMRKKECEQCKGNAVHCLLLLFRATRGVSVERIQRHLQTGLWAPAARRYSTEIEKLRALITTRDPAAASITYWLLEKQVVEQTQNAEFARKSEERAAARASQLEDQLAEVQMALAAAQSEVDRLTKDQKGATQAHENDKAHWKDDYEQLRGQVLRRLKDELSLLDEGLHALRRDPPKVHVMVDHAERAIDGLKREMEQLRGRN